MHSVSISSLHGANARFARAFALMIALAPLRSPRWRCSPNPLPSTFTSSANCSLSAPAFCETFNQGPSAVRGRGGDPRPLQMVHGAVVWRDQLIGIWYRQSCRQPRSPNVARELPKAPLPTQ